MPGIGGTKADEPVATTKRRAVNLRPAASISVGETNFAAASTTVQPSFWKRSTESCGAMAAMTLWT